MNHSLLTSIRAYCARGFILSLFAALLLVSAPATPPSGYSLVWSDEFTGTALDTDYWNIITGTHYDAQRVSDAITVGSGLMTITSYTDNGVNYTGFLSTRSKYQPLYGYIEVRMESLVNTGVNHAFWLQGPNNGSMVGDPWNAGIEIDVVEHRHTTPSGYHADQATAAVHWDGYTGAHHKERNTGGFRGSGLDTGFHTYAVEWTPTEMKFYYDDVLVYTLANTTNANDTDTTKAPVPQCSEFIYLTAAVRDSNFSGPILPLPTGYGTQATSTTRMKVDYVRVYQKTADLAAPAVPGDFVVASGNGEAALRWTLSANAQTHNIKRSLTRGGPYTTIASGVNGDHHTDTGLTNGTTYYYVVSAVSPNGESANSSEATASPMSSFTEVIVDNADTSGVTIIGTWTTSSSGTTKYGSNFLHDGNPPGTNHDHSGNKNVLFSPNLPATTRYDVYLNWAAAGNRAIRVPIDIEHADGTATVHVDQTSGGVWHHLGTYTFDAGTAGGVRVRNAIGDAHGYVVADAVKFTQLPLPAPTGLGADAVSSSQIDLAWTASLGATDYTVRRATTSGGPYTDVATNVVPTSYMDTGRSANTTYHYVVAATTSTTTSANSAEANALTAPATPTGVVAYPGDGRIVVEWNPSPGATEYNVKRAWSSGGTYTTIGTPATPAYINTNLTNGTTFYYKISATNDSVESADSVMVSATPQAVTLVKDNADASGIAFTGTWTTTTATSGYYGTNYRHDGNTGGTGGKKVTFTPTIATAGYYEVFVRWTAFSNRATNAPIDVVHAGGTSTFAVNQQANHATWVSLGTFLFNAGTSGKVVVRNDGANGYVIADAVQLILR